MTTPTPAVGVFVVTGLQGITLGAGHFPKGHTVYEPWMDGAADRLEHLGLVAAVGTIAADEVPDLVELAALIAELNPVAEPEPEAEIDPLDGLELDDEERLMLGWANLAVTDGGFATVEDALAELALATAPAEPAEAPTELSVAALLANAGLSALDQQITARLAGTDLRAWVKTANVPVVTAYVTIFPDDLLEVIAVETKDRERVSLLTTLKAMATAAAEG